MQFQLSPTPHQRRIRRIPTITLQTMKHIRGNCMRNSEGGGAWPGFETTRQARPQRPCPTGVEGAEGTCRGAGGRRRGLAGHTRTTSAAGVKGAGGPGGHGRASRSTTPSRRLACGDLAGGRALRRPEPPWSHKQPRNANARQPERAAARSRSQWSTQRSRAATTSATWTAFRAAPLRRLSPETTSTSPRLPSTAWS